MATIIGVNNDYVTPDKGPDNYSKSYHKIKGYYQTGIWDINRVNMLVGKKLGITKDEYFDITGKVYPNK